MRNIRRRSALLAVALVGLSVSVFVGVAQIGGSAFVDAQNRSQLEELTQLVLRRAELEIDFAVVALSELAQSGATACTPASLAEMRRLVYVNSTIKDIRVVDRNGRTLCSAFAETLAFDMQPLQRGKIFAARNSAIGLTRIAQKSALAMGVVWSVQPGTSLVAVVNTDALLFAVLPPELRDAGAVHLELSDGEQVARFASKRASTGHMDAVDFESVSQRYPFSSHIAVAASVFRAWNRQMQRYFLGVGGGLGLAFGLLLAGVAVRRRDQNTELDSALYAREFKPFLQPIVSLKSGEIVGCEVLARWIRADGTVESPHRFIRQAEESGLIVPLTQQLVAEALDQLRSWMNLKRSFTVAFNIHPGHLMSDGFVADTIALVEAADVAREQVVFELTERQQLNDLKAAAARIAELRELGFKVAIDDAGTGHSGLSYLQRLGADIVKIDKLFVDSIEFDHSARVIVDMLVRLAGQLGMTTVAEGVERPEQVAALKACGVDKIQGFLIAPALPSFDFLRLIYAAGKPGAPPSLRPAMTA